MILQEQDICLDRDAQKWFRPVAGQFQMYYKLGHEQPEYVPDFAAEAVDGNYVCAGLTE